MNRIPVRRSGNRGNMGQGLGANRAATVAAMTRVARTQPQHLYWPDLPSLWSLRDHPSLGASALLTTIDVIRPTPEKFGNGLSHSRFRALAGLAAPPLESCSKLELTSRRTLAQILIGFTGGQ